MCRLSYSSLIEYGGHTELCYSWNRNTAVLIYNLLLGHGE